MNKLVLALLAIAAVAGCIAGIVVASNKGGNKPADDFSRLMKTAPPEDKALVEQTLASEKYIDELLSQTDLDAMHYEDNAPARHLTSTNTYLTPLACNNGINFDTLPCTSFSSLLPSPANLEIPCGTCVEVDITDGSTVELPNGLLVSGMLRFRPTANVVIRTTSVFVEGILKIETPNPGNQVKFSLYGLDAVTYTSTELGSKCAGGCGFGFMPIAVVGGKYPMYDFLKSLFIYI